MEERGAECCGGGGRPHLLLMFLLMASTPTHSLSAMRGGAGTTDGLLELSQAVTQLTQRFATLEVSLESRLVRLADTATKGEMLIETLSSRLSKVDSLVEKVEALDSRLTLETTSLKSTIRNTNRDLQGVATQLELMDSRGKSDDTSRHDMSRQDTSGHDASRHDTSRHDTRSSLSIRAFDADNISATITRSIGEYVELTLPRLLNQALNTLHDTLYKKISKSVGELQDEVRETREELEDLSLQALTAEAETREVMQKEGKITNDAVRDIKNKIQLVHQDLSLKITSVPSLQQMNHTLVQSIASATAGLNLTLLEAARRRGVAASVFGLPHPLHCPDPTTVADLLEVKQLLQSLLKKSEDLRRGLTKQASEGVDLLKLLHQRFSVLLRRMNTEPDHGQILMAEMQDLGSLVESSYTAVLIAQNAFIDSCKRIQNEEPTLEHKITEILDKLVTDIDLGYQLNRQQLSELREVVERLGDNASPLTNTQPIEAVESEVRRDQEFIETNMKLGEVREVIIQTIEETNTTVAKLKSVEQRLDEVSSELVGTDWSDLRQKEPADQLVTTVKDLKGFAQEQIIQSLNLQETLLIILEHLTKNVSVSLHKDNTGQTLNLMSDSAASLTLPPSCTAALLQQVRNMPQFQAAPQTTPATAEDANAEDHIPAWYTDPDFLSGNYGTPDRGFPVFREEEWMDMDEDYARDDYNQHESSSSPPVTPTPAPAGVKRYFGIKKTTNAPPLVSKKTNWKEDFP